jgi:hypothetical protein
MEAPGFNSGYCSPPKFGFGILGELEGVEPYGCPIFTCRGSGFNCVVEVRS